MTAPFLIIAILIGTLWALCKAANRCFDDADADQFYYDDTAIIQCPHTGEKTDVTVDSCVTCETIVTYCDDCGAPLSKRTEC